MSGNNTSTIKSALELKLASREVRQRFNEYRRITIEDTNDYICPPGIKAESVTEEALRCTDQWDLGDRRGAYWDWRTVVSDNKTNYPKHFDIALWKNGKLIGISTGRTTYSGRRVRLNVVEGMPRELGDRPNILPVILGAYEIFGSLIGADSVRIMYPVNQEVIDVYQKYQYHYDRRGDFMTRDL